MVLDGIKDIISGLTIQHSRVYVVKHLKIDLIHMINLSHNLKIASICKISSEIWKNIVID